MCVTPGCEICDQDPGFLENDFIFIGYLKTGEGAGRGFKNTLNHCSPKQVIRDGR